MKLRTSTALAAFAIVLAAGAASAQTFNVAAMSAADARKNMQLALSLSFTAQCKGSDLTEAEGKKLLDFSDALAKKLKLNPNQYEAQVEKPVFDAWEKDEAAFCKTYAPQAKAFVKRIP